MRAFSITAPTSRSEWNGSGFPGVNAVSFIRFHPDHPAYPRVLRNYLSGGSDIILPKSDPLFDQVIAVPHVLVADEAEEMIRNATARRTDVKLIGIRHMEMLSHRKSESVPVRNLRIMKRAADLRFRSYPKRRKPENKCHCVVCDKEIRPFSDSQNIPT